MTETARTRHPAAQEPGAVAAPAGAWSPSTVTPGLVWPAEVSGRVVLDDVRRLADRPGSIAHKRPKPAHRQWIRRTMDE
ncbi:hypothetical protein [Nocardia sp. NPDC052566]|uniref:hypothetical protein n=1 Tax=Nocardia sp. NPDC052566 TaxID=3364330 RepID=UPI0037C57CE1